MPAPTTNFADWQKECNGPEMSFVYAEPYMLDPDGDGADLYILKGVDGYEAVPFYRPEYQFTREKGGYIGPETYYLTDATLEGILKECREYHPGSKPQWELDSK